MNPEIIRQVIRDQVDSAPDAELERIGNNYASGDHCNNGMIIKDWMEWGLNTIERNQNHE